MRARAVIGASFGDEGKGLVTDFLCSQGAQVVVRFNGGAQAGHTVVTPEGQRHVFSHFGSGTFLGVPTFLSQFFVCNPILFFQELKLLHKLNLQPRVFAHPECLVTTFADMLINQALENRRANNRHGSCGIGFNETILRSNIQHLKITMSDLWNRVNSLERIVCEICEQYAQFRGVPSINIDGAAEHFLRACWAFADYIEPLGIGQCTDPVFEGAQGLLLDRDNKAGFPHLTNSKTGLHNVKILCQQAKINVIEPYYVSRTYLTRHGAGPLQNEDGSMSFEDTTNVAHPFQGQLRFAPLDDVWTRCAADANIPFTRVLTHCDQLAKTIPADLFSYGPTRTTIWTR